MENLHRTNANRVADAVHHMLLALEDENIGLALSNAKRVRRLTTLEIQLLAEIRDNNATRQEATST